MRRIPTKKNNGIKQEKYFINYRFATIYIKHELEQKNIQ